MTSFFNPPFFWGGGAKASLIAIVIMIFVALKGSPYDQYYAELGHRLCRIGFMSNLNGLRIARSELTRLLNELESLDLYPFKNKYVDPLNPFKMNKLSSVT